MGTSPAHPFQMWVWQLTGMAARTVLRNLYAIRAVNTTLQNPSFKAGYFLTNTDVSGRKRIAQRNLLKSVAQCRAFKVPFWESRWLV